MNTKKISIKDVASSTLSNADGVKLQTAIDKILSDGDTVVISFYGINVVSSSFLNSSLGNLIDKYGFDILAKIKLIDYTATIASYIKSYISNIKSLSSC